MVLVISFFAAVLISVLWLVFAGFFISARYAGADFAALGMNEAVYCVIWVVLPFWVVWSVWGRFYSLYHEKGLQRQFLQLSSQIRQNQEYSDVIARLLLKNFQLHSHSFAMSKIELYIGEMNEILADILRRYHLINDEETRSIWATVRAGNRWGFAKAFVDLYNSDTSFENKLTVKAKEQALLAGSLTEFCARYTRLLGLLKEHDGENILQDVIETGVFGRVFAMFARIVRSLNEKTPEPVENAAAEPLPDPVELTEDERFFKDNDDVEGADKEQPVPTELFADKKPEEEKVKTEPAVKPEPQKTKKSLKFFWGRLLGLHDEDEEASKRPDPLTLALERSFGAADKSEPVKETPESEPETETVLPETKTEDVPVAAEEMPQPEENEKTSAEKADQQIEKVSEPKTPAEEKISKRPTSKRFAFSNTNKTIKNLQKEWEEMKKNDKAAANAKRNKI